MKKLIVLGLLLAASTGCGRGWFPHLFRGAPCNGLCSTPAPTLRNDCEGCNSAGYAAYDDGAVVDSGFEVSGGGYDMGTVIGTAPMGTLGTTPMSSIPNSTIVAPSTSSPLPPRQ